MLKFIKVHNLSYIFIILSSQIRMRYHVAAFALKSFHPKCLYTGGRLLIGRTGWVADIWYLIGAVADNYSSSQISKLFKNRPCKHFGTFYFRHFSCCGLCPMFRLSNSSKHFNLYYVISMI